MQRAHDRTSAEAIRLAAGVCQAAQHCRIHGADPYEHGSVTDPTGSMDGCTRHAGHTSPRCEREDGLLPDVPESCSFSELFPMLSRLPGQCVWTRLKGQKGEIHTSIL